MLHHIEMAIDFVEENLCADLTPEQVASRAYLSPYHFQRLFTLACGVPLGEYIRSRRLTLAGAEIAATDARILDIALKYGYESPESFSRAFTRFHGITPMAARRNRGQLRIFPRFSVESMIKGASTMSKWKERGYAVKENAPVYYTQNMDATAKWFEEVLGWYAGIDQRDEEGRGTYGCVLPFPAEVKTVTMTPFNGFHLFFGEPSRQVVAFMQVDHVENLRAFVLQNGWQQVSDIQRQHWGGMECDVTTIDGGVIRFFQLD